MSFSTNLSRGRNYRWSSQLGLYKYHGSEPIYRSYLHESGRRMGLRYFIVTTMSSIAVIVVCLMIFDFSSAVNTVVSESKIPLIRQGRNINNETRDTSIDDGNFTKNNLIYTPNQGFLRSDQNNTNNEIYMKEYNNPTDLLATASDSKIKKRLHSLSTASPIKSPQPFGFDNYPFPLPFHKNEYDMEYPQLENYKKAKTVRNIGDLIRYMGEQLFEKSKSVDLLNPKRQIKISGIYLHPRETAPEAPSEDDVDIYGKKLYHKNLKGESSLSVSFPTAFTRGALRKDPFVLFKPRQPGDINLLADGKFRFSPTFAQNRLNNYKFRPAFRPIPPHSPDLCAGAQCNTNPFKGTSQSAEDTDYDSTPDVEYDDSVSPEPSEVSENPSKVKGHSKQRPLSVMLDIYPMENNDEETMAFPEHLKEPTVTTSRPQLRPRPTLHYNRPLFPYNSNALNPSFGYNYNHHYNYPYSAYYPGYYNPNAFAKNVARSPYGLYNYPKTTPIQKATEFNSFGNNNQKNSNSPTQMVVHLNLFPKRKIIKSMKFGDHTYNVIDRKFREQIGADDDSDEKGVGSIYDQATTEFLLPDSQTHRNITHEDILKGYDFKLPGPEIINFELSDGISRPAVDLLSIARSDSAKRIDATNKWKTKNQFKRDREEETGVKTDNSRLSVPTDDYVEQNHKMSLNMTESNIDGFIAVPLLDKI